MSDKSKVPSWHLSLQDRKAPKPMVFLTSKAHSTDIDMSPNTRPEINFATNLHLPQYTEVRSIFRNTYVHSLCCINLNHHKNIQRNHIYRWFETDPSHKNRHYSSVQLYPIGNHFQLLRDKPLCGDWWLKQFWKLQRSWQNVYLQSLSSCSGKPRFLSSLVIPYLVNLLANTFSRMQIKAIHNISLIMMMPQRQWSTLICVQCLDIKNAHQLFA